MPENNETFLTISHHGCVRYGDQDEACRQAGELSKMVSSNQGKQPSCPDCGRNEACLYHKCDFPKEGGVQNV